MRDGPRRPLKVALVTPVFPPSVGGAELNHSVVARTLARSHQVEVLTADLNLRLGRPRPSGPSDSYRVLYLPSHQVLGERVIRPTALFRRLREFRPDVVWTNQPSVTGDLAACYARIAGVPWVATYHGDLAASRPYARLYQALEFRMLRRAASVIPQGDTYARRLVAAGLAESRIHPVAPGPGIGGGSPPPAPSPESPFEPGGLHRILFVGGLDRARDYKRPGLLLAAVAELRRRGVPAQAWFVGDGDRRSSLELQCERLGITDAVEFVGRVDDTDLARFYANAWVLVLPSTSSEAFGLVTLEALHYGCPSIVPETIEAGQVLGREGAALTYSEADPEGLVGAIASLWSSPSRREAFAQRCRALAGKYSWASASARIAELIMDAATAPASSGPPSATA